MGHTRCQDIERALQDLVDGMLPPDETVRLRGHAEGCSRCDARIARRTALMGALVAPPEIELPAGFRSALLARLHEVASADPTPLPVRYAPQSEPWWERVAEWWSDARLSPMFQPAAVLAGFAMAVVLATLAAQVVGTWRSRGTGSPAGSFSLTSLVSRHIAPPTEAPPGDGSVPAGTAPASPPASPVSSAALQLAAVSPEAESVVLRNGFDVVAAADGASIDPAHSTVRLQLDGHAVASTGVRVTRDFVSYTPESTIPEGSHTVHLEVRGADGHLSSVEWGFYVVGS